MENQLSASETAEFAKYRGVVKRGLETFFEVGLALLQIRQKRLYRAEYSTFEEYCEADLGLSPSRAYQLIGAAGVMENLSTHVDKPSNEAQVRPLTRLPPEDQQAAWELALEHSESGTPTGSEVQHVVRTLRDLQPAKSREQIEAERRLREAEKALDQRYEERLRRFIAFSKLIDSVKYIADFHADSTGDFWDGITNAGGTETFSENSRKAQSLLARMESQHPNAVRRPTVVIKKLSSE